MNKFAFLELSLGLMTHFGQVTQRGLTIKHSCYQCPLILPGPQITRSLCIPGLENASMLPS